LLITIEILLLELYFSDLSMLKERRNPLKNLAYHSTTTCSAQAAAYGKCIVGTYKDITKEACKDEFLLFKRCLEKAMKKAC